MKGRESGMPDEATWSSFFDAEAAVALLLRETIGVGGLVEFGCGYGTFTIPAARRIEGTVTALDIDPEMIAVIRQKAKDFGLSSICAEQRDFVAEGTGLEAQSQAYAMIYNLLHIEHPVALLREARRVLQKGGQLSVIHWRSDIETPRGPPVSIRPISGACHAWIKEAGFVEIEAADLQACCPYHFGLIAKV